MALDAAACGENYSEVGAGCKWSGSPAAGRGCLVVGVLVLLVLLGFESGHVGEHGLTAEGTRDTMLQKVRLSLLRFAGLVGLVGQVRGGSLGSWVDATGPRVSTDAPAAS